MVKRFKVFCLDDGSQYIFLARTPYETLKKMKYYLGLSNANANDAVINKSDDGKVLWFDYSGKTYSVAV